MPTTLLSHESGTFIVTTSSFVRLRPPDRLVAPQHPFIMGYQVFSFYYPVTPTSPHHRSSVVWIPARHTHFVFVVFFRIGKGERVSEQRFQLESASCGREC